MIATVIASAAKQSSPFLRFWIASSRRSSQRRLRHEVVIHETWYKTFMKGLKL